MFIIHHFPCGGPSISGTILTKHAIRRFRRVVLDNYRLHRCEFPWRQTADPYRIFVSEIMLQQTQTDRVLPKYEEFVAAFPDFASVADAPQKEILQAWQGLGYNRRALALKKSAEIVERDYRGLLPASADKLLALPGVGKYTAAAVLAFAFNQPVVFIETNIRAAFIHHFFADRSDVRDAEIVPLVEQTVDRSNPREWYYALMDYGVVLKKTHRGVGRRSAHYQRQSRFAGSNRQLRGRVLKLLLGRPGVTARALARELCADAERLRKVLDEMKAEGFVEGTRGRYRVV